MKKTTLCVLSVATVMAVTWSFSEFRAEAQTPAPAAGMPPIGRSVDIQMVVWPFSTAVAGKVQGTLVAMTDQWIVVKQGSDENWLPRDKVMTMKVSK